MNDPCAQPDVSPWLTETTRELDAEHARRGSTVLRRLEDEVRPLLIKDKCEGGYDCCGCSTYDEILDHAIRIVREESK